jgi:hypothetical protein
MVGAKQVEATGVSVAPRETVLLAAPVMAAPVMAAPVMAAPVMAALRAAQVLVAMAGSPPEGLLALRAAARVDRKSRRPTPSTC